MKELNTKSLKFFQELREAINSYVGKSRTSRTYVPLLEDAYEKYQEVLPTGLQKFIECALIAPPGSRKYKDYAKTSQSTTWREVWMFNIHHYSCPVCGSRVEERRPLSPSTKVYCSGKCRAASAVVEEKRKNTCLDIYGYEYAMSHPDVTASVRNTMEERYGGHTLASPVLSAQVKETMLAEYGVESPLQNEDILNQVRATKQERYGGNTFDSPVLRAQYEQTMTELYGAPTPFSCPELLQKAKDTLFKNYGVTTPMHIPGMTEQRKATSLERYGTEHPTQSEEVQEKTRNTMQERYNCDYPMQNPEIREKQAKSAKRIISFELEGREFRVQSKCEQAAAVHLAKKHGVNKVHTQFHKEFSEYAYSEMRTFPDLYVDVSDTFIEIKSNWTFMGRQGKHKRALTEGSIIVNKKKARLAAQSGNSIRWVIVTLKPTPRFLMLPKTWYDDFTAKELRRMVEDFIARK